MSLGIDPVSTKDKTCNLDCVYCQLGKTGSLSFERKVYVEAQDIVKEIAGLPDMQIDYLTFSGRGEPTLAKNLGEMIRRLRACRKEKVAVITNSVLMTDPGVRQDLAAADFVLAKLDACDQETFLSVNHAMQDVSFDKIVQGIKIFQKDFPGKLALQIMFVEANKNCAEKIAKIAREIAADEVEINTPLRPCGVKPLSQEELAAIKKYFDGLPVKTVYERERKTVVPLDDQDTVKRHGNFLDS